MIRRYETHVVETLQSGLYAATGRPRARLTACANRASMILRRALASFPNAGPCGGLVSAVPSARRRSVDGFHSRLTRSTPVSIGRVNSPRAVSGLLARKA